MEYVGYGHRDTEKKGKKEQYEEEKRRFVGDLSTSITGVLEDFELGECEIRGRREYREVFDPINILLGEVHPFIPAR